MGSTATHTPAETVNFVAQPNGSAARKVRPGSYLWPELRISRRAVWKHGENDEVDYFLKGCGSQNRRRGSTRILSEVACTYVLDTEMRKMVLAKYEGVERDVRRATDIYRKIGKNINQFIRESSVAVRQYDEYMTFGERFGEITSLEAPYEPTQMWQRSNFLVNGQDGFGKHQVGFSLAGNPELPAERQAVISYLAHEEGLNTRFIDGDWEPHAVFFDLRPELKLGSFAMRYPQSPSRDILLDVPSACTDV